MFNRPAVVLSTVITVLVVLVSGCAGAKGPTSTGTGPQGKKVALLSCPASGTKFCSTMNEQIVAGLEAHGITVQRLDNDGFDAALQVQQMDSAVAQRPDLIITDMSDPAAMVPALQRADRAKVPVMTIIGRPTDEAERFVDFQTLIPASNSGRFPAELLVQGMKDSGYSSGNVIILTGAKSFLLTQERLAAFRQEMAKHPEYTIVADPDAAWDPAKAGQLARQLFSQYRNQGGIQGVFAMTDEMAVAAINAAREAGIPIAPRDPHGGTLFVGGVCAHEGVQAYKDDTLLGSVTEIPSLVASAATDQTLSYFSGQPIEPVYNIDTVAITKSNYQDFPDCDAY